MPTLIPVAQTYLNYRRKVDPPVGSPMGPTTYGAEVYVVSVEHPTPDTTVLGMSALRPSHAG